MKAIKTHKTTGIQYNRLKKKPLPCHIKKKKKKTPLKPKKIKISLIYYQQHWLELIFAAKINSQQQRIVSLSKKYAVSERIVVGPIGREG